MKLGIAGKSILFAGRSKGMGGVATRMLVATRRKIAIVVRVKDAIDEALVARPGHARHELIHDGTLPRRELHLGALSRARSSSFRTLPVALSGRASTISTRRGTLKLAIVLRA